MRRAGAHEKQADGHPPSAHSQALVYCSPFGPQISINHPTLLRHTASLPSPAEQARSNAVHDVLFKAPVTAFKLHRRLLHTQHSAGMILAIKPWSIFVAVTVLRLAYSPCAIEPRILLSGKTSATPRTSLLVRFSFPNTDRQREEPQCISTLLFSKCDFRADRI